MLVDAAVVRDAVARHGRARDQLLPVLQDVFAVSHHLADETLLEIAREMNLPSAHVYGVASFYHFLSCAPLGRYLIHVCKTIGCYMAGKDAVLEALTAQLKIGPGETTPDGKFTLRTTNCIGWCHKGPAMLINDEVYTELTPEKVVRILQKYR